MSQLPPSSASASASASASPPRSYLVLRAFVSDAEQRELAEEAIGRHVHRQSQVKQQSKDNKQDKQSAPPVTSSSSATNDMSITSNDADTSDSEWHALLARETGLPLNLGISGCGGSLAEILSQSALVARRAFAAAHADLGVPALHNLANPATSLTGLALLYGPRGSMKAHFDSPTQPGQRNEWLANISLGLPVDFVCNTDIVRLYSGDVLVMDSMAVLHGVKQIVMTDEAHQSDSGTQTDNNPLHHDFCNRIGLPGPFRLGILFWQGRDVAPEYAAQHGKSTRSGNIEQSMNGIENGDDDCTEGLSALMYQSSSDDDDDNVDED
jgi:hypothetical protein